MIQVQIASQITADGLAGVRWVLIDTPDTAPTAAAAALPPSRQPGLEQPEPADAAATAPTVPAELAAPAPSAPAPWPGVPPVAAPAAPHHHAVAANEWALTGLKLLVVGLGLGVGLWTAQHQFGPAAAQWRQAEPATLAPVPVPPPVAAPALPEPASVQPTRAPAADPLPNAPGLPAQAPAPWPAASSALMPTQAPGPTPQAAPDAAAEMAPRASDARGRLTAGL